MATGKDAMRLGVVGFIVPFIFVMSPALILQGSLAMLLPNLATAVAGTGLVAVGMNGFLYNPIGWLRRILIILAGIFLIVPVTTLVGAGLILNIIGMVLGASMLWPEWRHWTAKRRLRRDEEILKGQGGAV